ncbi:transporter substrate-binding domain-containing protein [Roseomonas gilardii]|uniref:transporter substrate-binding domain-containing protein n=1 Tax=Roseomonas gilardii TaxID=257708 RepID=UPI000950DD98|nr:transporter substrate-binding domain-containing protein [Roseomonas gilardii]
MSAVVKLDNVHKSFGPLKVLDGVSFAVDRGEVVAVIGQSGSGKSTALRCINALESIESPNRVPFLLTGKADMVIASFSVTEERQKVIDFSRPYGVIQIVVAAKKGTDIKDYAALAGKRVGTTRGSSNDKEFTSLNTGAQIVRYDDDATLVTALVSGQVDIMATSPQIMATANTRAGGDPFEVKLVIKTNPYAIGIRKGDTALKAALDQWIAANLENGKLREIYKKYNGVALPEQMPA